MGLRMGAGDEELGAQPGIFRFGLENAGITAKTELGDAVGTPEGLAIAHRRVADKDNGGALGGRQQRHQRVRQQKRRGQVHVQQALPAFASQFGQRAEVSQFELRRA